MYDTLLHTLEVGTNIVIFYYTHEFLQPNIVGLIK